MPSLPVPPPPLLPSPFPSPFPEPSPEPVFFTFPFWNRALGLIVSSFVGCVVSFVEGLLLGFVVGLADRATSSVFCAT
ncbi:MAG: hypothetical protein EOM29_00185 [Bacteroidia bacterium]|nr:hypothetical protein [Bacteroidia bacterium]